MNSQDFENVDRGYFTGGRPSTCTPPLSRKTELPTTGTSTSSLPSLTVQKTKSAQNNRNSLKSTRHNDVLVTASCFTSADKLLHIVTSFLAPTVSLT